MSAIDDPPSTSKYEKQKQEFLGVNPIFVALQEYISNTAKLGTPQQLARERHEDCTLFVSMFHEANWRLQELIAIAWKYLSCRQPIGFTACLALIDLVDG